MIKSQKRDIRRGREPDKNMLKKEEMTRKRIRNWRKRKMKKYKT